MGTSRLTEGAFDFAAGVDSGKVTTIASQLTPNGLKRNQLAWLSNATCRGGGITQRTGWQPLCTAHLGKAAYQGGWIYENSALGGNPYLVISVAGEILRINVDTDNSVVSLSAAFGLYNPPLEPQSYFAQGEEFLVIQAGDGVTLPLFWDGVTLRRSTGAGIVAGVTNANFTSPAINTYVLAELVAAYIGGANQVVTIGGEFYLQVLLAQSCELTNVDNLGPGNIYPAGTQVFNGAGVLYGTTLVSFIVPAATFPVALPVWIDPVNPMVALDAVVIDGTNWTVTAAPYAGIPVVAVDEELLINLTQLAGVVVTQPVNLNTIGELPPASAMAYFQGRLWYARDRQYTAGDIVLGPAGTQPYRKRDSILKITENPLALAGDGFTIPTNDGVIRALHHSANMDTSLGETSLYVFTRKAVYSLTVPVKRSDWITTTEPLQRVVQNRNGTYGDRGVVSCNGDLMYQSFDGIRSLFVSVRDFSQWSNVPISSNINRLLDFNTRSLMRTCSGIYWQNRLLQTALPYQTDVGVAFKAIATLDFDLISSLQEKLPPAWEGSYSGLDILQLFNGDFGGLDRAFAVVRSDLDGSIGIWELDAASRTDNGENRIEWFAEFPAWTWSREFELKKLDGGELWIDRIFGTVDLTVYYRPDAAACWEFWTQTQFCSSRSTCEDESNTHCYPSQYYADYGEGHRFSITLPTPPAPSCSAANNRPSNIAFQFQTKVVVKGFCRIRGILVYAVPFNKAPFSGMACP
jgi:hypothetical protein